MQKKAQLYKERLIKKPKHVFSIFATISLVLIMAVVLVACKSNGGSVDENKDAFSKDTETIESIDMKEVGGNLSFIGYEFVPEDFYLFNDSDGYAAEKTVVVKFNYTNNEDAEKIVKQDFIVKGYQHGAEMNSPQNWNQGYSIDSLQNTYHRKTVIQGGTMEVGFAFVITDKSPLTITASYNGETKDTQKMELMLENIPDTLELLVNNRNELIGTWVGINTGYTLTLTDSRWELSYSDGGGQYSSGWDVIGNRLSFGSQTDYDFRIEKINDELHLIANENGRLGEFTDDYIRK